MTDWPWPGMFGAVQRIAHSSETFSERMSKIHAFAAQHPAVYDKPDYWRAVASTELPFSTVMAWAREGLPQVHPYHHWSLVMLDCGDCPEIFQLREFRIAPEVSYESFEQNVRAEVERHVSEFPIRVEEGSFPEELVYHNVRELDHPILSWNQRGLDYHSHNGYLLWLAVATFALCEALQDAYLMKWTLKGRKQMMWMVGFEEIYFYLGVVTGEGWRF